jgi:hypothetical protein
MDIFYALKPLYCLSKFVGLTPFSFYFNSRTGEHVMTSSGVLCFLQNVYTVVIFCGMTVGFVVCVQDVQKKLSTKPGQVVSHMFSAPANFITSMMDIIMMTVVNRKKMMKLVMKLSTIDEMLLQGKEIQIYQRTRRRMLLELIIIFGVLIPFLCYDSYFFGQLSSYVYEGTSRFSNVVKLTTVIQFLWAMRFFRHRLWLLNRKLSACFNIQSNNVRKPKYTSRTVVDERYCSQSLAELEKGYVPTEIYGVFRGENVGTLAVLPVCDTNHATLHTFRQNISSDRVSYILNLRITYNHIYEATLLANSVYGISIILTLMYCFVSTVSNAYFTFLDNFTNFDELVKKISNVQYYIANHILWVIISVGTTIAISGSCHMVKEESKILVNNLQKIQLHHPARSDILLHLQQFSTQVSENNIHFTASGFFSVNLSLLYAFIASSVTYVIILIQFRLN